MSIKISSQFNKHMTCNLINSGSLSFYFMSKYYFLLTEFQLYASSCKTTKEKEKL